MKSVTASFYEPVGYLTAGMENVAISNTIDANYPSSVQVFTRDGRQILGQPLDDEQAATLVQDSRGFVTGATYSAAYLNQTADSPYRDMSVFYGVSGRGIVGDLSALPVPASGLVRRHFLSLIVLTRRGLRRAQFRRSRTRQGQSLRWSPPLICRFRA